MTVTFMVAISVAGVPCLRDHIKAKNHWNSYKIALPESQRFTPVRSLMATATEHQPPPIQRQLNLDLNTSGPETLDDFFGQLRAVEHLKVALAAWRSERRAGRPHAFPSLGFWGPPGLGKTELAHVLARELKASLVEVLGCSLSQPHAINRLLMEARDGTVLFVDEADEIPQESQSVLLRAVEERVLFLSRGDGKVTRVPLAKFTLILASNRMQEILPALRDRLQLNLHFEFYDPDILAIVTGWRAKAMGWEFRPKVVLAIGRCARGTPRQALRLLSACWRVACSQGKNCIDEGDFQRACGLEDIDTDLGLDRTERLYLRMLNEASGPVRPTVLASRLALPLRQVSEVTEAYLLRVGLISRLPEGRELTATGHELCERLEHQPSGV